MSIHAILSEDRDFSEFDMIYISLGAGVQSSALLICSVLGLHHVPSADFAIFADTQDEPRWVYEHLEKLEVWARTRDFPIHRVTAGRLSDHIFEGTVGKGATYIPAFCHQPDGGVGIFSRVCTSNFKIRPIEKFLREHLGCPVGGGRTPWKEGKKVLALLGISAEEAHRMKQPNEVWCTREYPLVYAGLTRSECKKIVIAHGFDEPRRSACVYCPFHSQKFWHELKKDDPQGWELALQVDDALRELSRLNERGWVSLRREGKLGEVVAQEEEDLADSDGFGNECEGLCGL